MPVGWSRTRATRRWRQTVGRRRRLIAAVLAGAAVVLAVTAVRPPGAVGGATPVVVAAADLAGGVVIGPGDVRAVTLPTSVVPAGYVGRPDALVGRTLAGAVRRGEPITDARIVGPGLLTRAQVSAGYVAVPVRIADVGSVALVRAGDRIDVLATGTGLTSDSASPDELAAPSDDTAAASGLAAGAVTPVATDVVVVAVPRPTADQSATGDDGALVVLAVSRSTAVTLAGAAVTSRLSITLR